MKNRSKYELIQRMLEITVAAGGEIQRIKLMYGAFMSFRQFNQYIPLLLDGGLLEPTQKGYRITQKGNEYLQLSKKLNDLLAARPEVQNVMRGDHLY